MRAPPAPHAAGLLLAHAAAAQQMELHHSAAHRCCNRTLRVAMAQATTGVCWTYHANRTPAYVGVYPKVFDTIAEETGYTFQAVPLTWRQLIEEGSMMLAAGHIDLIPCSGDTLVFDSFAHILRQFDMEFAFTATMPVITGSFSALQYRTQVPSGPWRIFAPFAPELWAGVVGAVFSFAAAIVTLNALRPQAGVPRVSPHGVVMSVYHAWATILDGEDYEWITWPGRLLRLSFLFFVLISVATYTANLAAFFTQPSWMTHGPKNMGDFRKATVCVSSVQEWEQVRAYVPQGTVIIAEYNGKKIDVYDHEVVDIEYGEFGILGFGAQFCIDKLRSMEADVALMDNTLGTWFLLHNCHDISLMPDFSMARGGWTTVMTTRREEIQLLVRLNQALVHVWSSPTRGPQILQDTFGVGQSCPVHKISSTPQVSLASQRGLFIICGSIAAVAVAAEVGLTLFKKYGTNVVAVSPANVMGDHTATEGEMLKELHRNLEQLRKELHQGALLKVDGSPTTGGGVRASVGATAPAHVGEGIPDMSAPNDA